MNCRALILLLLTLVGCSTLTPKKDLFFIELRPLSDEKHQILYSNNRPLIIQQREYIVALQPAVAQFSTNESLSFLLAIHNQSDEPLYFDHDTVRIFDTGNSLDHLKPIKLRDLPLQSPQVISRIETLLTSLQGLKSAIRDTESYLQGEPKPATDEAHPQILHAYMHEQLIPAGYWYGARFEVAMPAREFYLGGLIVALELNGETQSFRYQIAEQLREPQPNRFLSVFEGSE
ncbi:MAG TPA: hypothetical protein DCZ03_11305 [Gammaproteobacteria bacterium]|nr:hypothetical protein [Gammaproteobacteria bacterium]